MKNCPAESVSIIICVYTERRWRDIISAVRSCQCQSFPCLEIIIVVDHNPNLLTALTRELPEVTITQNIHTRGLCGARNTGVSLASTAYVAFLDDDAKAAENWLLELMACFCQPDVIAAGGTSLPVWETRRPMWMPDEFLWTLGCSYRGMPSVRTEVRSLFGGCMCVKRCLFLEAGGFHEHLGRNASFLPAGGEEAELFLRARETFKNARCIYEPNAVVWHKVSAGRTKFSYFLKRCLGEGCCKAALPPRKYTNERKLASELKYTLFVLPRGMLRGLTAGTRGWFSGLLQTAAIVAGFTATLFGYSCGRVVFHFRSLHTSTNPTGIGSQRRQVSTRRMRFDV